MPIGLRVNCVSCGHSVDLRGAYDDYDGQVKCFACGATLHVRTEGGMVKAVHYVCGKPEAKMTVAQQMQHTMDDMQ